METLQIPLAQIYPWVLHHETQSFQRKFPTAALWMTWQCQLQLLLNNKLSSKLCSDKKIYLQDGNSS